MDLINEYGYDITNKEQRAERIELVQEKAELYCQAYEAGILADNQMEDYLGTLQECIILNVT